MAENKNTKVTVEIFGDTYSLKTNNEAGYVRSLAKDIDKRMRDMAQRTRSFDGKTIAVLAALDLEDAYFQLKKDYDELLEILQDK